MLALPCTEQRHRGDSSSCGQSPMDFESISLAARTQCHARHARPVRPPPYEEDEEKQHEEAGGGADEEHEKESQQLKRARACVCDNLEARHTRWL